MPQERVRRFIGRAIVIDPATRQDSEFSAFVCVLLTGEDGIPSVTIGEARTLDELLAKLRTDEIAAHHGATKVAFEPPKGDWPVSRTSARQRYEALAYDDLNRVQTVLSGR